MTTTDAAAAYYDPYDVAINTDPYPAFKAPTPERWCRRWSCRAQRPVGLPCRRRGRRAVNGGRTRSDGSRAVAPFRRVVQQHAAHLGRAVVVHSCKREVMRLSTRNQLPGTVISVEYGSVMSTVKVELRGGDVVTASITLEAANDLELAEGAPVTVLVKSTEVMLGVDD